MFSAAFSSAFARSKIGYIGPVMAQAALFGGAGWAVSGSGLLIGGKRLIGPAGKIFVFSSPVTAEKWIALATESAVREVDLLSRVSPAIAAGWVVKKRARLAVVAAAVVKAASKMPDESRRAALIAESDFCLSKWHG